MESQKKYWNIDPNSGTLLQALIHTHTPKNILEIGTSNGYSAIRMGHVATTYSGHITTIEFFEKRVRIARENSEKEGLSKTIEVLQGDAMTILPSMDSARFDFIFLDANKEEYGVYFQHAMRLITPNGIIVADNVLSHREKLSPFFDAVKNDPRASAREFPIGMGLMIIRVLPQYP